MRAKNKTARPDVTALLLFRALSYLSAAILEGKGGREDIESFNF
jgi:hypothetical protein